MVLVIINFIIMYSIWRISNKFKKLKVIKKLLLKIAHYRYIVNLRPLIKVIAKYTDYNYILDIVDLFSELYYGSLLKSKKGEKSIKKIKIFN